MKIWYRYITGITAVSAALQNVCILCMVSDGSWRNEFKVVSGLLLAKATDTLSVLW